ncbi:MAG: hypothetical protein WAV16_04270 [Candidatus Moraniibacteriota bacterium]
MPEKREEEDIKVKRFVEKVSLDMEDEDFTKAQKVMIIIDLLREIALEK